MEEHPGFALPLMRFLFGCVGGVLIQLPAAFLADFASGVYAWVLAVVVGSLLTGFLAQSPPARAWGAPLVYLFVAVLVVALLFWRGQARAKDAPMLGSLFGGWSLLAAGFALRRRRKLGEGDA
ncbi:MAG TPA: hypothetical protein VF950_11880 [Planctomycetota bacterium]